MGNLLFSHPGEQTKYSKNLGQISCVLNNRASPFVHVHLILQGKCPGSTLERAIPVLAGVAVPGGVHHVLCVCPCR